MPDAPASPGLQRQHGAPGELRAALSLRQAARIFGIDRRTIADAIARGELRAARLGARRYTILRHDLEGWLRSKAIQPTAVAEQIVARVLERRAERAASR